MPGEWILLNPGPANTTRAVREALVTPDLCHREPEFFEVMQECRAGLVELAGSGSEDYSAVIFTGSGTAAVEATLCSVPRPGEGVLVVDNGVYGDRMRQILEAHRIPVTVLKYDWVTPANPSEVDAAFESDPALRHLAVAHHETTTGLLNPIRELAAACRRHGRRLIVDAMSSFGGEPVDVGADGVDYLISSANKCLQGIPGLSFVIARREALAGLAETPPRSVYLNLHNQWQQEEAGNTPFTPAVQVFFALRQALEEMRAEGLANRIQRYAECCRVLRAGAAALGLEILVPKGCRSHLLTTFRLPARVTYEPLHYAMKARGYIIYAGQGDLKRIAFRIANMGTLTPAIMRDVVTALRESLVAAGGEQPPGSAAD